MTENSSNQAKPWLVYAILILLVLGIGGWLRFAGLGSRPMHADEAATGARILGDYLETGVYEFDPTHRHGPLLTYVTAPWSRLNGESDWMALEARTLRQVAAVCGFGALATIFVIGMGFWRTLFAMGLVATSPLLVYYSRMYIHEPVFLLCAIPALWGWIRMLSGKGGWISAFVLGLGVGCMAATRETVVISLFAWGVAWGLSELRQVRRDGFWKALWQSNLKPLLTAIATAFLVILIFYSAGGNGWSGFMDFLRTYVDYETTAGHDKPMLFYFQMLVWPKFLAGVWWSELAILLLALFVYLPEKKKGAFNIGRFLFEAGFVHLIVYSMIAYKTPWLASLGWLHVCLSAGYGTYSLLDRFHSWGRVLVVAGLLGVISWQGLQAHRAAFRLGSDGRNPYAYVPTVKDIDRLPEWLEAVRSAHPEPDGLPLAVVGDHYWPLPWYLRRSGNVGYFPELLDDGSGFPILLLMPSAFEEAGSILGLTHTLLPWGLRDEVPLLIAIRNDIWESYLAHE